MNSRTFAKLLLLLTLAMLGFVSLRPQQTTAAAEVWSPKWNLAVVDSSSDMGYHSSIAYETLGADLGMPYVSYFAAGDGLKLARYKNGDAVNCSNGWDCAFVDKNGSAKLGYENSMVIDSWTQTKWIAYTDPNTAELRLAKVDINTFKSISTLVDDSGPLDNPPGSDLVKFPSIAVVNHQPAIANYDYFDSYSTSLGVFADTFPPGGDIEYNTSGSQPSTDGYYASIDYDQVNDLTYVAYRGSGSKNYPASHTLNYAGSTNGGAGGDGCHDDYAYKAVLNYICRVIDPTPETGNYISFHAGGGLLNWPQVAYFNATKHTLKYASYKGGMRSCGTGGVAGWECEEIETIGSGGGVAMAVQSYPGTPTIAYYDNDDYANGVLKVARLVGSGGNCGLGSAAGKWQCVAVDRGLNPFVGVHDVGLNPSITLSQDGRVYISYYDVTAKSLKVASEKGDAPTFSKKYNKSTVNPGETVQATYTITNNLGTQMTRISFTDYISPTLVPGMTPAQNTCFGTTSYLSNKAGFYLSGGMLGAGLTCKISVDMIANAPGTHVDTTGLLYSTEAQFSPGATATLIVKAFYRLFLPRISR